MIEKTFTFKSTDNKEIFTYKWLPDEPDKIWLVMQIVHGMAEHAGRYRDFAKFLTDNGIAVYANDLRGHGKTAKSRDELGFFKDKDGWKQVLEDIRALTHIIRDEHPDQPIVLFGHSMGSLFARAYISIYPDDVNGVILSGTSGESGFLPILGQFIALIQGAISGKRKPSKLLHTMTFKKYNKPFEPAKTAFDWLSRDEQKVQEYIDDPLCGFVVSNRFYFDLLKVVQLISSRPTFINTPKELPMLIISGDKDPVGNFGKGVKKVYNNYLKTGHKNIMLKLYPGARHEILNETNRQKVYNDILNWLKETFVES